MTIIETTSSIRMNVAPDQTIILGTVSRKKSSCSFGFCPNEGGEGPAQIFGPLFTNCIYWVNSGMGREGETPAQNFWHIGIKQKVVQVVQIRGRVGGRGDLDKIQKNSLFVSGDLPLLWP